MAIQDTAKQTLASMMEAEGKSGNDDDLCDSEVCRPLPSLLVCRNLLYAFTVRFARTAPLWKRQAPIRNLQGQILRYLFAHIISAFQAGGSHVICGSHMICVHTGVGVTQANNTFTSTCVVSVVPKRLANGVHNSVVCKLIHPHTRGTVHAHVHGQLQANNRCNVSCTRSCKDHLPSHDHVQALDEESAPQATRNGDGAAGQKRNRRSQLEDSNEDDSDEEEDEVRPAAGGSVWVVHAEAFPSKVMMQVCALLCVE